MALRINTNIAALNAHTNLKKTDSSLSKSLERLSTGLRINKSADDAAGLSIANVLKSQSIGIGQAIKNANDGISIVQIADGALDEVVNILGTIKAKAIQAAQDGQTTQSRKAIQADIDKLLAELDDIANTTAFSGQKLLTGGFVNKKFQVGAYSGQTVDINIASTQSTKIGHVTTAILSPDSSAGGTTKLSIYSSLKNEWINLESIELAYDNTYEHSMGALADAINMVSGDTGITAQVNVSVTSANAVQAGATGSDFAINGVTIGAITVQANDADGTLVNAINSKTSQHGVVASVDESGYLTLTSTDGRAIQVTGETGTVLAGSNLTTFGEIKLFQAGGAEIKISDEADNVSLNLTSSVTISGDTTTVVDAQIAKDSTIESSSVLKAGSTLGFDLVGNTHIASGTTLTTTQDSYLTAGSVIGSNSVIEAQSVLGGNATVASDTSTTSESLLKAGTILNSNTVIAAGTTLTTRLNTTVGWIDAGTTIDSDVTLSGDQTLLSDMTLASNSTIEQGSVIGTGSYIGADVTISSTMTITDGMTLKSGSKIVIGATTIKDGSYIGADITLSADASVTRDMTLKTGSTLKDDTVLGKGSGIGGYTTIGNDATLASDMTLAAGSELASGTLIKAGTVLTDDIWAAGGILYKAGTTLENDIYTSGTNRLDADMTLRSGSILKDQTVLAPSNTSSSGASATTSLSNVERYKLSDINVLTQESAQVAITIVDSALTTINKIKADLGSTQNQLTSTIANLTTTQVNVTAAESQIRDVDFAEESSNFARLQILMQAGTFAMAQANASSQNVLQLLQ